MKLFVIFLSSLFLFSACLFQQEKVEPEIVKDASGVILKMKPIWRSQIKKAPVGGNWASVKYPVNTDKISVTVCEEDGEYGNGHPVYYGLDVNTGEKIWANDKIGDDWISTACKINETLVFQNGSKICGLNINTGELLFTTQLYGWNEPFISGHDNKFYLAYNSELNTTPYFITSLWEGDMVSGKLTEKLLPDMGGLPKVTVFTHNMAGGVKNIVPFSSAGTNYLLLFYAKMTIEQGLFYLILYNEDNQEIVYDIKLPNEYANDALPVVFDNKVVIPAAGEIYCMDIFTKEVLWKDKSNLRYMDLFYQDGTVLVGLWGDGNDKILAYNAVTGNLLWQNDLMESFSSTYQVLNGIVYFVSNNLYAVDFKTGKEYWNIACPDQKMDHEAYFRNHCVVIPGKNGQKGKIIANSGMSTICYEAIQ